ncbi:MAG: hypothetical protein H6813_02920 [Phycisphaeraceae bacterium]|nr:hypothetical protein [Phycisphaeraceae bacterium]MCB9848731.1 hypothetical protein [Phycisphaeraceae bacterium]
MPRIKTRLGLRAWILALTLLLGLPLTALAWAFPRASRVAVYQSELADPETLAAVSGVFLVDTPQETTDLHTIDLGYATLALTEEPRSITQPRPGVVEIRCDSGRIVAFPPFRWKGRNGVWDPVIGVVGAGDDPESDPFFGMGKDFGLGPDFQGAAGFEWNASAVRTLPATAPVIWTMSSEDFGRLYLRTLFKAMEVANAGGGRVTSAVGADSITRFGRIDNPGRVHLAVWSRLGDTTQGLLVESDSPAWSRGCARAIASSWRPMIDEAPANRRELERLIDLGVSGAIRRQGD